MVSLRCSLDEKPDVVLQTLRGYTAGAIALTRLGSIRNCEFRRHF